jgi:integrase
MPENNDKSTANPTQRPNTDKIDERQEAQNDAIALPSHVAGSGTLDRLVDTARAYAAQATAENTNKAYKKDWEHFTRWCRRRGADPLRGNAPDPQLIGLYIADCAAPQDGAPALSAGRTRPQAAVRPLAVSTIERRLSGLVWHYQQRGFTLDRKDRHIATVLAGIRRKHARPPVQKEAVLAEDIRAMVATLPFDLRGLRDRAILLIGYAGGLRRSEIVCLDHSRDDLGSTDSATDSRGWVEIEDEGAILVLRGKTGWREVEIGRGSAEQTCPVHALEQWLHFAKIDFGPLFRRTARDNKRVLEDRLSSKHVARLIKQTVLDAGIRSDLPEKERLALYSGHSLRAGLASSAEVDERYIQRHLGHASAEMTRRYQRRRDRFRVNLTKAAGL